MPTTIDQNSVIPNGIDQNAVVPDSAAPAPSRGALGEIGTGLVRGALVDLPTLGGQALKYAGAQGIGNTLTQFGQQMGQRPGLTLNPEQHGGFVNTIAEGAEQIAPALAPALAVGGTVAAVGASPLIAAGAGAIAAGGLFAGQAGQSTLEKAEAKGVAPDVATTAARLNAAQTFATQTALGFVGGKMLGVVGTGLGKVLGREGAPLAEDILGQLTGSEGTLMPFLKSLPGTAAEAVGLGTAQAAGQAAIEQNAGIDDTSPWQAAKDAIVPMLGLTAAMTPLGLAGRALGVRSAKMRTETLSNPETAPEARTQLADQYAAALSKANPDAAAAFRANAETAIMHKQALPVDPTMFTPDTIQPPATFQAAAEGRVGPQPAGQGEMFGTPPVAPGTQEEMFGGAPGQQPGEVTPEVAPQPGQGELFGGTQPELFRTPEQIAQSQQEVDALHGQIKDALTAAGVTPDDVLSRAEFAKTDAAQGLTGQKLAQAYKAYVADPATQGAIMRSNAEKYETLTQATPPDTPERITNTQMSDAMTSALRQQDFDRAQQVIEQRRAGEVEASTAQQVFAQHEQELDSLHGQVNDALRENGIKPTPVTSENPAHLDAVIRENADKYEAMLRDQAAANATPEAKPEGTKVAESSAPTQMNTQLAEKMQAAIRQRDIDRAYQQAAAEKASQTEIIANRAKGEQLADAATRGEVQPDANAPKARTDIVQDWKDAVTAGGLETKPQSQVPFEKRMDALGIDKMKTHQEQIDALQAAVDDPKSKMSDGVRDRMSMLLDKWKADRPADVTKPAEAAPELTAPLENTPPAQARALGENIPTPAPDNAAPPAQAEALGRNIEPSVREQAQTAADKLDETLAGFNERLRNGETLTPLEQERYDDAKGFRDTLATINGPTGGRHDDAYIKDIVGFAKETEQPYTKSQRLPKVASPEQPSPAIEAALGASNKLSDMLTHLATNGSQQWVKDLATRLGALGLKTTIDRDPASSNLAGTFYLAGTFNQRLDRIGINPGGESEQTVLHEATHAALHAAIVRGQMQQQGPARTQMEAAVKKAYKDWESIRTEALKKASPEDQYGLTNAQEFGAELMANPDFQQFLRDQGTQKSLWDRAVDVVRRLLGLSTDSRDALEKAMAGADVLLAASKQIREFDSSPARAGKVVDDVLHSFLKDADALKDKVDFGKLNLGAFRTFLGAQTVQYMADRVRAIPELVRSGFAQGVDAYQAAHQSRRLAAEHIESTNGKFATGVQQMLGKLGDADKARDLSMQMMKLGGESSIGQFDYKMNYADNKKAHPDLDPRNKGFIDDLHREFTQLQRTNPDAAKSLVDGEKLNRKMLVTRVATIIANTMDARAGATRRLEAELTRMAPNDAARAALEARLANARMEGQLAAIHSRGLDFMGKDLLTARNGDTSTHYDGASSALAARVDAAFKAANALPDGTPLRAHMAELEQMYRPQYANPYFSLGRSGNYFVNVGFKNMDAATAAKLQDALKGTNKVLGNLTGGQSHAFFRVETADQAAGLRRKLEQAGGDKMDMAQSASGLLADKDMVSASGVSPALRQMLASLHDEVDNNAGIKADQALAMKGAITRQLLSMLPETSARSAQMQRRGVPGYDGDFVGNFARRASGAVQDISNMYTAPAFGAAQKQMTDSVSGLNRTGSEDSKQRAQMVADEVNTRYAQSMQPISAEGINRINSLGHSFYLAINPAFYIRTMAQPFHRAVPITGSRYGFVTAAKEQAIATGTAMKVIANTIKQGWDAGGARGVLDSDMQFKDIGLSKSEEAFVQEMHDRGKLNLGQARQLQRLATGGSQKVQDLVRFASMTAQYAEMTNRLATGLAAFRLASRDPKVSYEAAVDYADRTIDRAMDNFDPNNTARWLGKHGPAGKVTPLLTAFMNYNLQTMQQITRTVHDGLFNRDPSAEGLQRAKEARREFGGLMATTAMISGAMGLPFANAFAGVYNMLTKDQDDPSDIRTSARNFLADTFGQQAGDVISHGAGRLIGLDTSTFGLENLLPGSEFLASRKLMQDRLESQSQQLLGPALNAGIDTALALSKMSDGYYVKGIEQALPSGLKAPYKAVELATRGYTDSKGNPLPIKATGWDVALQAAGFRSATRAEQSEAAEDFGTNQQLLQHRRQVITDNVFKAATSGDEDAKQDAFASMAAFNEKNPYQPIRGVADAIRTHLQGFAVGEMTGTGVVASPRKVPIVQNDLRFAAMPQK